MVDIEGCKVEDGIGEVGFSLTVFQTPGNIGRIHCKTSSLPQTLQDCLRFSFTYHIHCLFGLYFDQLDHPVAPVSLSFNFKTPKPNSSYYARVCQKNEILSFQHFLGVLFLGLVNIKYRKLIITFVKTKPQTLVHFFSLFGMFFSVSQSQSRTCLSLCCL